MRGLGRCHAQAGIACMSEELSIVRRISTKGGGDHEADCECAAGNLDVYVILSSHAAQSRACRWPLSAAVSPIVYVSRTGSRNCITGSDAGSLAYGAAEFPTTGSFPSFSASVSDDCSRTLV